MDIESHTKVLVTGGAGFIGSHLTNYLANQGNDVIVVDNFIRGLPSRLEKIKNKMDNKIKSM
mgnify:CR=1 FL=1